jgi:hypothetical protein
MNTVLVVCAVVLTAAILVAIVFLINTLRQVRRTARQAEILLSNLNQEMSLVSRITDSVSSFVDMFASPWVKVGSWVAGMVSAVHSKHKKETKEEAFR